MQDLLTSDYARRNPFSDKQREALKTAEGFFDKDTGKTIIIAENISLRPGESVRSGVARVVLHERIGHDGLNTLLGKGGIHRKRWDALRSQIPSTELAAIAKEAGYQHLSGDLNALALEWFARKAETDMRLLESQPLLKQMWETLKQAVTDLMAKAGLDPLKGQDLDTQVHEMMNRARGAALRPGAHASRVPSPASSRWTVEGGRETGDALQFSQAHSQTGNDSGANPHSQDTANDAATPQPVQRVRPPFVGDPQYGSPRPITGSKPVEPPLDRFSPEGQNLTDAEIEADLDEMWNWGHSIDRHGPDVKDGQLVDRALNKIDPITMTQQDGVHPRKRHSASKHATQFTSKRAMAQAKRAVEMSAEYQTELAVAISQGKNRFEVDNVMLEAALGLNYLEHVRGKSIIGSNKYPQGTADTNLTGGRLLAVFQLDQAPANLNYTPCMQSLSEHTTPSKKTAIQRCLSAYLNVETQDLDELARWCRNPTLPEAGIKAMLEFKQELKRALDMPGTITPALYERWTDDSSYETQEEVQQRLQEIWDACFG